jgi:hypothetical protein
MSSKHRFLGKTGFNQVFNFENLKTTGKITRQQGEGMWKVQHMGRITASEFHRVFTRIKRLLEEPVSFHGHS